MADPLWQRHAAGVLVMMVMMMPIPVILATSDPTVGNFTLSGLNTEKTSSSASSTSTTGVSCLVDTDCNRVEHSDCDSDSTMCRCRPDFPITDGQRCYKESKYEEFCELDLQCQFRDKNRRCMYQVCKCQARYVPKMASKGQTYWCVENTTSVDMSVGSYINPTLFGIMAGLALMFIVMCVVLRLFAKAQFRENRTIFNTPNPRLMNVSLLKDNRTAAADGRKSRRCASSSKANGSHLSPGEEDQQLFEVKDSAA